MSSILKVDTIQDQSGNNIINESGNVITIGASGDTITVPAGATVSGFTSAGIDDNATSVAITIDSSERVGIGTTSPPFLLSLSGNSEGISFTDTSGGSNAKAWLMQGLDSDFRLRTQLDNYGGGQVATIISRTAEVVNTHQFFTEDSERMRLTTTGLGIGTSSPDNSLHVLYDDSTTYSVNTHNSGIQIENNNGTDNTFSQLHFRTGNADSYIRNIREGSNLSSLAFLTDNGGATGDVGEAMRINSSGNVGIGTSSPSAELHVKDASSAGTIISEGNIGQIALRDNNGGTDSKIATIRSVTANTVFGTQNDSYGGFSEKMRITSDGKVGIGITSPASLLHISGTSPQMSFTETDQSDKQYRIGSFGAAYSVYDVSVGQYRHIIDTNGNHIFNEGSQDCDFRVESNGNANMLFVNGGNDRVGIGTSSPGRTLEVAGQLRTQQSASGTESTPNFEILGGGYSGKHFLDTSAYYIGQNSQARNLRIYSGNNSGDGVQLTPQSNSFGSYSDERLKKNITDLTNGLDKISAMRPVNFKYKTDADDYRNRIGIIAQSLIGQVDEALDLTKKDADDETKYYNVRYQDLIPVLVKALQEQQTQIQELEARITTLEANNP